MTDSEYFVRQIEIHQAAAERYPWVRASNLRQVSMLRAQLYQAQEVEAAEARLLLAEELAERWEEMRDRWEGLQDPWEMIHSANLDLEELHRENA